MPPYIVSYERRGAKWLAIVYVRRSEELWPAAVLTGRWAVVRRACRLAAALAATEGPFLDEAIGAGSETNQAGVRQRHLAVTPKKPVPVDRKLSDQKLSDCGDVIPLHR